MARRCTLGCLLVGALFAGLLVPSEPAAAAATTLYVDQHSSSCSDTVAGTTEQPLCTIGAAAGKAGPGTTVVVASGTYAERVKPPSGGEGSPVTFTTAPGATVVVTGGTHGFYLWGRSWVTIKGFTVRGSDYGIYVANSSHVAVLANHVSGIPQIGINLTGSSDSSVEDNAVLRTGNYGIRVSSTTTSQSTRNRVVGNDVSESGRTYGTAGISLWGGSANTANTVVANRTYSNADSGIDAFADDTVVANNLLIGNGNRGIDVQASHVRVLSNTAYGNNGAQVYLAKAQNVVLRNNVLDGSAGGTPIWIQSGSDLDMDYDLYSGGLYTPTPVEEPHGIQAAPRFVEPCIGVCGALISLALTPGSPAVDSAGSDSLALLDTDAFGGPRVDDLATPNLGAGTRSYADRGALEMRNPGFEADTSGWNTTASSPGVTLATVPGGHTGAAAAVLRNTGPSPAACDLNDSPNVIKTTHAGAYAARMWVRADTPGAKLRLSLREWSGTTKVGLATSSVTLTTDWQWVWVRYRVAAPGSSTLDLHAYILDAPPGTCFYADDASVAPAFWNEDMGP